MIPQLSLSLKDAPEKFCTKCGLVKPLSGFAKGITKKDGLSSWCRVCVQARSAEPRVSLVRKSRRNHMFVHDRAFRAHAIALSIKHRALKIGVPYNLSTEWVEARLDRCALTGLPFNMSTGGRGPYSPSVDRINSNGGYVEDNCRVILWAVNAALGTWGLEAFESIAHALIARGDLERPA